MDKTTRSSGSTNLRQALHTLVIETRGAGFTDISQKTAAWLASAGAGDGLLTLFIRHTSASLVIQENADADVLADLQDSLDGIAPEHASYRHQSEGPDDMPAHVKAMLTGTSLSIPVIDGRLILGTWQGIYVAEHRRRPHRREVALHFLGTLAAR